MLCVVVRTSFSTGAVNVSPTVVTGVTVTWKPLSTARVRGPTSPGYGARLFARWKAITASFVIGPKYPVMISKV